MEILIAEDDPISRRALEVTLRKWGHDVIVTSDGIEAWEALQSRPPLMAILDWMMPGLDGVDLCGRVRASLVTRSVYVILLTARDNKADRLAGLESGADDYIAKPFDRDELQARVKVGLRVATLQRSLAERVTELEQALGKVNQLQGLLPICSYCKRIRDDGNYWQRVEEYVSAHSGAQFSHGICPTCFDSLIKPQIQELTTTTSSGG